MSQLKRSGLPSWFPIGPRNTKLEEKIEIFLPFPLQSVQWLRDVENISDNQRQWWQSLISARKKPHKYDRES